LIPKTIHPVEEELPRE